MDIMDTLLVTKKRIRKAIHQSKRMTDVILEFAGTSAER